MTRSRSLKTLALSLLSVCGVAATLTLSPAAHATGSQPPYEIDPESVGTIAFYNSAGTQITSGDVNASPFAAYAVGSTTVRTGDTSAGLYGAQPNPNTSTAGFNKELLSGFTAYPITSGAPSAIETLSQTHPVVTGLDGDESLATFVDDYPNTGPDGIGCAYEMGGGVAACTNTSYEDLYQLRLRTANTANEQTPKYDVADVMITDPVYSGNEITSGTWTQVYPAVASGISTTTSLAATPTSPAKQGDDVVLTATIAAADSSKPAGAVQFKVDGVAAGGPVAVNTTTETASLDTAGQIPPGGYTITAAFTPTDTTDYQSSTGTLNYIINPVASKPKVSGTFKVGDTVKCTETTTAGETVAYVWKAGSTKVGSKSSLTIPASAAKKSLTCTATVTASGAASPSSATSTGKTVALGAALKDTTAPKLSGSGKVGATEKVSNGDWSPKATSYSYQWLLNGKDIKGATHSSYKIASSDVNKKLACEVTAKATGYADGTATTKSITVKK